MLDRIHPDLPTPPPELNAFKAPRSDVAETAILGIPMRFQRFKPPKLISSLAPPSGVQAYSTAATPIAHPWQIDIPEIWPQMTSTLNLPFLQTEGRRIMAERYDDHTADYVHTMYTLGGTDHCTLPVDTERYFAPNRILPHSGKLSDAWDDLIDKAVAKNRVIISELPIIPGTIVTPINVVQQYKHESRKWKYRPTVDGRHPRADDANIGAWCDPRDRVYKSDNIHHTIAMLIHSDADTMSVFDYEAFFTTLPRAPREYGRNCIRWKHRDSNRYQYFYFMDDVFGHVATPARINIHALCLQHLQEEAMLRQTGIHHPVSRRVDDTLVAHSRAALDTVDTADNAFIGVCHDARQPLQLTKKLTNVVTATFDGFLINLRQFANTARIYNVHPGGVGIGPNRQARIRARLHQAAKQQLSKAQSVSLISLLAWAGMILIGVRAALPAWRKAVYKTPHDNALVVLHPDARSAIHALIDMFKHPQLSVPFYKLFQLTPPQASIFTDASGVDGIGGFVEFDSHISSTKRKFFFTEWSPDPLKLTCRKGASAHATPQEKRDYENSTAYIELVGLWYFLSIGKKRLRYLAVTWHTDSQTACNAWTNQSSNSEPICRLLVAIAHLCVKHNILISAQWVPRKHNVGADMLTHVLIDAFCSLHSFQSSDRLRVPTRAVNRAISLVV
jgi:hypothetical protein